MGSCLLHRQKGGQWSLLCSLKSTGKMGRANSCPVRKSPILLGSLKNKNNFERKKLMRMSLKKRRKIGDPENHLHRAVLLNNTIEFVRKLGSTEKSESVCDLNEYDTSHYSLDEEEIFNSIRLPAPITPISDAQDNTEDIEIKVTANDDLADVLLKTLPITNTHSDVHSINEKNIEKKCFIGKQQICSQELFNIPLLYDCVNSNSYLKAF